MRTESHERELPPLLPQEGSREMGRVFPSPISQPWQLGVLFREGGGLGLGEGRLGERTSGGAYLRRSAACRNLPPPERELPLPTFPPGKLRLPKLRLPKLRLPKLRLPKLRLPKLRLPKLRLPKLRLPKLRLPKLRLPKLRLPKLRLPKLRLPKLRLPKLRLPKPKPCNLGCNRRREMFRFRFRFSWERSLGERSLGERTSGGAYLRRRKGGNYGCNRVTEIAHFYHPIPVWTLAAALFSPFRVEGADNGSFSPKSFSPKLRLG